MTQIAMVITAPYNAVTQQINLGDVVTIDIHEAQVLDTRTDSPVTVGAKRERLTCTRVIVATGSVGLGVRNFL
jgi:hypothetical protein